MFEFLRRMIVPVMMIALVGFLATIIFQWGRGLSSQTENEQANLAAVINGEEISWNEYNRVYQNLYNVEQQKTEDDLPPSKTRELQNQAWNQILQDRLLMQQAEKYNITVNDDELYYYMRVSPPQEVRQAQAFQTNGQFDYQKYVNGLADPNMANVWASFEPIMRKEIIKLKLQDLIVQTAHVTENEIQEAYLNANEKVKVGMINVAQFRFSSPPPTFEDSEVEAYFNEHKSKYDLDERRVYNLVLFEKIPVQLDWDIQESKIKMIRDSIVNQNADFAEMAKTYSEDGSAPNGGDLGWFNEGQMVTEFNNKVFSMKKGEVSEPVKTQFGWHIIKLFDTRTQDGAKQAKASHILLKVNSSQETLTNYREQLRELENLAREIGFVKAAEQLGLEVKTSRPFEKDRMVSLLGQDAAARDYAFKHEVGSITPVMENNNNIYVGEVAEIIPAGPATFEEVKQIVNVDLIREKVAQICDDTAAVIYSEIKSGASFDKAAKDHGETYDQLDAFSRDSFVKEINRDPIAIGAAFALKNIGDISDPVRHQRGTAIFKLLEKYPADLTKFTEQKDSISQAVLVAKRQDLYRKWFTNLIDNSEIVNNIQFGLSEDY